jgi:hypothetical protein
MMDTTKLYDRTGQGNVRRQVELVSDLAEIIHQGSALAVAALQAHRGQSTDLHAQRSSLQ